MTCSSDLHRGFRDRIEVPKTAEWLASNRLASDWVRAHEFVSPVLRVRQKPISENLGTGHLAPLDDDCNPQACRQ